MVNSYKGVSINHVDVEMEGEGVLACLANWSTLGKGVKKLQKQSSWLMDATRRSFYFSWNSLKNRLKKFIIYEKKILRIQFREIDFRCVFCNTLSLGYVARPTIDF